MPMIAGAKRQAPERRDGFRTGVTTLSLDFRRPDHVISVVRHECVQRAIAAAGSAGGRTRREERVEDLDEATRDLAFLTVLAADFDYQVKNGGFGQLIFNWGRERLEQCDGMLRAVQAPVALSFISAP